VRAQEAVARDPNAAWLARLALAMAHARLGHSAEAHRWLEQADGWQRQERRRIAEEWAGFASSEWADFQIFHAEAVALIGQSRR
jgi:hypothetical protein